MCVQTRGIDAVAPVESLYSERSSMHIVIVNYNVFVLATHTENGCQHPKRINGR